MINLLGRGHGLDAADACMLCSVCGDLRISEIVDLPNWVVSFYFPRIVFAWGVLTPTDAEGSGRHALLAQFFQGLVGFLEMR